MYYYVQYKWSCQRENGEEGGGGAMLAATCIFNPGPNDNHIGKLLGQKMMNEIDYFVSCILIFQWIFWAIPMLVVLHYAN
jgi:hypothetical protein